MSSLLNLAKKFRKNIDTGVSNIVNNSKVRSVANTVDRFSPISNRNYQGSLLQKSIKAHTRGLDAINNSPLNIPSKFTKAYGEELIAKPAVESAQHFKAGKPVQGAWSALKTVGAMTPKAVPTIAVSGLLNAVGAKASGQDVKKGFWQGASQGAGVSKFVGATNPVLSKVVSKFAPGASVVANRVAPAVANVAQGVALDKSAGLPTTAGSVSFDAVTGLVGGKTQFDGPRGTGIDQIMKRGEALGFKGVSPRVNKVHPEDLDVMRQFADKILRQKGAKQELGDLGVSAQRLADHYFGGKWKTTDNKKLAQAFEWAIDLNMNIPREARGQLPKLGFAADQGKSVISQIKAKPDFNQPGVKQLDQLMNDPNRLLQMGYSKKQVDKINAKEARRILDENIPPFEHATFMKSVPVRDPGFIDTPINNKPMRVSNTRFKQFEPTKEEVDQIVGQSYLDEMQNSGVKRWFNKVLNPLKNAPEKVQNIMQGWRNENMVARTRANEVAGMFTDIDERDGWKLIQFIQEPTNRKAMELDLDVKQYSSQIDKLRNFYDSTRNEGIQKGLDIKYLDNYLNQIWKESFNEINAKVKAGAGKIPGFTKDRSIPSYQEGVKLGLTPRFTHPAQLAAHYRLQLDKAMSNKRMVEQLIDTEMLLPANKAPADWKSIESPFFPKVRVDSGAGEPILMDYKAPPDIANAVNNVFEVREPGLLTKTANFSKNVQEFALSAGIPFTPMNSFTLANIQKEVMAGRVRGPVVATAMSLKDSWSANYFKANQQYIKDMASEGLQTWTNTDYTSLYKNLAENQTIKQRLWGGAKNVFNEAFNEPTFKRFMPILQTEFYKDSYNSLLKSGMDQAQARSIAVQATKNFNGITDAFSRPGQTEEVLSTFVMAPRFREAMIDFWGKTLKSLDPRTFKDPTFKANRKFVVGAVVTWAIYNVVNKATTGQWMYENKDGKELSLEIPMGGGRSFFLPFLFTIGTVPRRVVEAGGELAGGDIAGAVQKFTSFASIPVGAFSQGLTNRNFYGAPIYQDDDPGLTKLAKAGGTVVGQMSHPWIRTGVELATGQRTIKEALPGMLEVPLYPSASSDVAHLRGQQVGKFKELNALNPASAYAYSERIKAEKAMTTNKAAVKKQVELTDGKKDPTFFDRLFNRQPQEATPDMLSAYFGVDEYNLLPQSTAMQKAQKEGERQKIVTSILTDEDVLPEQKIQILNAIGEESVVDEYDIEYYQTAKLSNDIKVGFVKDYLSTMSSDDRYESLLLLTQEVHGQTVLSSGVLTSLYNEGLITKAEQNVLKNVTYNKKTGELDDKPGAKKGKKANVKGTTPSAKVPNMTPPNISIGSGNAKLPSVSLNLPSKSPQLLNTDSGDLVSMSNVRRTPIGFDKNRVKVRVPRT